MVSDCIYIIVSIAGMRNCFFRFSEINSEDDRREVLLSFGKLILKMPDLSASTR